MVLAKNGGKKEKNTAKKAATKRAKLVIPPEGAIDMTDKPYQTKMGSPIKFDADKAIALMQAEIDKYMRGEMHCYEVIPLSDTKSTLIGKSYPLLFDIAIKMGLSRETLTNYCTEKNEDGSLKNKQLFDTYKAFKELGESMLIKGGLSGVYDSRVVQFVGNVNYGMIPKQQVEQSVEIKSMDKVYAELDKHHEAEEARVRNQKAEMEARKQRLDKEFAEME